MTYLSGIRKARLEVPTFARHITLCPDIRRDKRRPGEPSMINTLHGDMLAVVDHRKGRAYVVGQIRGYSQEKKVKNGPAKPSCPLLDDTFAMTVAFDDRDQTCGRHSFRGRITKASTDTERLLVSLRHLAKTRFERSKMTRKRP